MNLSFEDRPDQSSQARMQEGERRASWRFRHDEHGGKGEENIWRGGEKKKRRERNVPIFEAGDNREEQKKKNSKLKVFM